LLRQADMPDDLKYIAVIESALRPHAASHGGAVGFWQFIRSTGLKYGLTINSDVDDRRNFFRSTQAAIEYLRFLYQDLGSWTLAAAAYNMGEEGLKAEILAQEVEDYYRLYLSLETQRYIFRALAAKLILSNPKIYGFDLDADERYPKLAADPVTVNCPQETPILLVAKAAQTDFKVIKDLNPQLRGHYLAKGDYQIWVPLGAGRKFSSRFKKQLENHAADSRRRIYVVRKGDNLTAIARRFDVPLPALLLWNSLSPRKPIHPGDRLMIYVK
jgi:membrane-bound lytic murein transglycosylase D